MLISVTDTDLKHTANGGKVGKTDGTDILFTSVDGTTKLNHEIESYSSSTGASIFWVQVPSLAKTSDTVLYIYFGNAAASDQQSVNSTWESNFGSLDSSATAAGPVSTVRSMYIGAVDINGTPGQWFSGKVQFR